MAAPPLHQRELVIVTGKGGTGRTTVAAGLAALAAARGLETLLIEMVPQPRAPRLLGAPDPGYEAVEVREHLHLCRLTPGECLEEIAVMRLRLRALYRLVFENRAVSALMGFMPGMNELLMLGKVAFMVEQGRHGQGGHRYDLVVVDGPPTGEAVAMLRLPGTIRRAVAAGPLARDAGLMEDLLQDPSRTATAVVTLPEELPVNEALELRDHLDGLGMLSGAALFVNRVTPTLLDPLSLDALRRFRGVARSTRHPVDIPVLEQLDLHDLQALRQEREAAEILRLGRGWGVTPVELPEIPSARLGPGELFRLCMALERGCCPLEGGPAARSMP